MNYRIKMSVCKCVCLCSRNLFVAAAVVAMVALVRTAEFNINRWGHLSAHVVAFYSFKHTHTHNTRGKNFFGMIWCLPFMLVDLNENESEKQATTITTITTG